MDHAVLSFTNFNARRLSQIPYIWVQGPMAPTVRIAYVFNPWHSPELWPLWLSSASGFWVWCLCLSCYPAVCDVRVATSLYGKEFQLLGTHLENATPYQYGDNDAGISMQQLFSRSGNKRVCSSGLWVCPGTDAWCCKSSALSTPVSTLSLAATPTTRF